MIAKSYILNDLERIESLYRRSRTVKESLYFSKLAVLELCGWIEMSIDEIVQTCAHHHLTVQKNKENVQDIIDKTYGFDYETNFRRMLIQLVGTINVERIESDLDPLKFQRLKSELGNLKKLRNVEAHTHIKGTTKTIDAPSVTKNRFNSVYEGLKDIHRCVNTHKF